LDWKIVGVFISLGFLILGLVSVILNGFVLFTTGGNGTEFIVACAISVISVIAFSVFIRD